MADALVAAVVLVITFHAVSRGRLTLQAAALFFYLSQQFLGPLSIIFRQGLTLAATRGTAARILDMFATQSVMPDGTVTASPLQQKHRAGCGVVRTRAGTPGAQRRHPRDPPG